MDYVKILEDLISIDTTVPPGRNYEKIMDYLMPLFQEVGCETEKICIPKEYAGGQEGRVNLIAHRRSPGKPRLILYTHADVVPVAGWDGFKPKVEDGKIYGRGSSDDKGNIVALLMGLEKARDKALRYDTLAIVTVDEEVGHADANEIRYLRRFLEPVAGACFLALDADFGYVIVATLGILAMGITVKGKSVHQGRAYLGENAVEKAILLMQPLLELQKDIIRKRSKIPASPELGIQHMQPNLSITMIHGGIKVNIVPDECVVSIARRIIPEENIDDVEKEIMNALNSVSDVRWEVKTIMRSPTVPPTYDEPVSGRLAEIIGAVTGGTGKYGAMGTLPIDPVALEWQAKIFGTGLSRSLESNAHGKNECVYQRDIEHLSEIIAQFIAV